MSKVAELGSAKATAFSTWVGFAMMCLGMFIAILDIQVVAPASST